MEEEPQSPSSLKGLRRRWANRRAYSEGMAGEEGAEPIFSHESASCELAEDLDFEACKDLDVEACVTSDEIASQHSRVDASHQASTTLEVFDTTGLQGACSEQAIQKLRSHSVKLPW